MTSPPSEAKRYRLNVGVVVMNAEGKVWLGRRAGTKGERTWQFPQGGVDRGEELLDAAKRELFEETGLRSVTLLARVPGWITYDFPDGFSGAKAMKGYAGQTQAWFAFRFDGEDEEVNLAGHVQEFDAWRWADIEEAPDLVVPFKREAYLQLVEALAPIVRTRGEGSASRGVLLMIHGVCGTGSVWERMAADFRMKGWAVKTPTLKADLRLVKDPPAALLETGLSDYVEEACGWANAILRDTGAFPVLFGHSMGALIVQKMLERGLGRAGVLLAPAPPAGLNPPLEPSVVFTFANVLMARNLEAEALKIWRTGFEWGVLNRVPKARRPEIWAAAVFDPGRVFATLKAPEEDPSRIAFVADDRISAPILILAGEKDRTTPISWAVATAKKYGLAGEDFKRYPDNAHWLIDEPGVDRIIADIETWLEAKGV